MMQRARQIVVVADRRKVSTDQFNYWSPIPARWRLITDDAADPAALDELRKPGHRSISPNPCEPSPRPSIERQPAVTTTSDSVAATPSAPAHGPHAASGRAAPAQ